MNSKVTAFLANKIPSINKRVMVAAVLAAPMLARADDAVDTSAIVAKITAMGTAAGVIGLAYLTVVLGVKAFKLLRSAA